MKIPFYLIIALALLAMCSNSTIKNVPAGRSDFSFVINKSYHETSLDSHSYFDEYRLKNDTLSYRYEHSGYPANESKQAKLILNDSVIGAIRTKLKELDLFRDHKITYPDDQRAGFRTEQDLSLVINSDSESYHISFSGHYPDEIKDTVYNNLSVFWSYISSVLKDK
jgi:hypothetical protein